MSKDRIKIWLLLLLCTGGIALFVATKMDISESFKFASSMGVRILLYICLALILLLFGRWIQKKGLDQSSTIAIIVVAAFFVGMIVIFYRSEKRIEQMQAESGILAAIEHPVIKGEDIDLITSGNAIIDRGESHWKSWLDYTVMLQSGGSLQYSCERFVDTEDAKGRIEGYIKSDSSGKEWRELFAYDQYMGVDYVKAYEWLTGSDTEIHVFYYYFQADEMILCVKLRNADGLNETQSEKLIEWFLGTKS